MGGLTDMQVKKAKADEKPFRLADEKGLFLFVTTAGAKLWRMRYRFNGKEQTLSLGSYPLATSRSVSLVARAAHSLSLQVLALGPRPSSACAL